MAESILATGDMVSTFQLNDAGDGSLFVALSTESTSNACEPSVIFSEVNCNGVEQIVNEEPSSEHSR